MCGPGDPKIELPPGTDSFQMELTPSGHLGLPCGDYPELTVDKLGHPGVSADDHAVNLLSNKAEAPATHEDKRTTVEDPNPQ